MCYIVFIGHSLHWSSIKIVLLQNVIINGTTYTFIRIVFFPNESPGLRPLIILTLHDLHRSRRFLP